MNSIPPIMFVLFLMAGLFFVTGKVKYIAYLASVSIIFQHAFIDIGLTKIEPSRLIYTIFILLIIIILIVSKKHSFKFSKKYDKPLLFALYIIPISILANIIAAGDLVTPIHITAFGSTVQGAISDLVPLEQTYALITQNLFVIFPIVIYVCLRKLDTFTLQKCINYFIYSVLFLTIWNICTALELLFGGEAILMSITNSMLGREGAFGSTQSFGLTRVGGFVGEPSHYSYVAMPAFGYVMGMTMIDKANRVKWFYFAGLLVIGLFFSFSTSGLLSFFLLIIIYSLYNIRKKYFFRLLIAIVPLLMAFIYFNKDILTIYYQFNYTKFDGSALSSFPIRLWSIKHNLALLFKYPLFGVGIGSTGALSGIVSMLAGIGFIGCIILAISFKNINIRKNKGILFALLGLLSYNLFAGDLSTVFSPIAALYFATSSRLNIC